jgi:hypothetical protein
MMMKLFFYYGKSHSESGICTVRQSDGGTGTRVQDIDDRRIEAAMMLNENTNNNDIAATVVIEAALKNAQHH